MIASGTLNIIQQKTKNIGNHNNNDKIKELRLNKFLSFLSDSLNR